ncbi:MAG TPA: carboxyl transferase domain-containing protein [Acidimicrobiales bacterium]|nr:carboxyl transferase domain-containing protein [Acidimicrobiales bacterium]
MRSRARGSTASTGSGVERAVRVVLGPDQRDRSGRHGGDAVVDGAQRAVARQVPLVVVIESAGTDADERVDALDAWGRGAWALARCSGGVPVIAVVSGPVVSGCALLLGLTDLVVMAPSAVAFVSGPEAVSRFTGVRTTGQQLGGAAVHATMSGLCAVESDDPEAVVADLLEFLPDNCDEEPAVRWAGDPPERLVDELSGVVPSGERASYDVRDVVEAIVDDADVLELWPHWAGQLVTGLARLNGRVVGIVANQPRVLAGTLDISASQKGARFVRLCDAFNLPILTLVDTPGFLPGKDLEWRGMIRHGAELAFAYAEATVPRLCVILRKAFGGAYIVMDSKGLGNDVCLAWPTSEIAVMGASGAVQILHRRASTDDRAAMEEQYRRDFLTPWAAAERGLVDAVIAPNDTRRVLCRSLEALASKREELPGRKHEQGPL